MSDSNKPGIAFFIIGVIALLWNGWGTFLYLAQAFDMEIATAELNADQIALINGMPAWYTALFAIAVFAGLLGSITLLLKKKSAAMLFLVSFITATIMELYWLFGTNAPEVFADMQPYLMPILIIVFAAFLLWYSKNQKGKGVLV